MLGVARALRDAVGNAPIIFTRRSIAEGGEPIAIGNDEVVQLYDAVGASGLIDFLDFEMSNDAAQVRRVRENAQRHGARVILSYHNFGYTPGLDFLVQRFLEAERLGGDVAKVAVMPRDRADVLTLLAATAQADAKSRIPLISMAMGPLGSVTRMIGGEFGSSLSFAVGEGSSAPGQIPIADLAAVFAVLPSRAGRSLKRFPRQWQELADERAMAASLLIVDELDADGKQRPIADLVEHSLLESALNEHAQLDAHRDQRQEYQ